MTEERYEQDLCGDEKYEQGLADGYCEGYDDGKKLDSNKARILLRLG